SSSDDGPYVWGSELQGIILSSFFYGYILTQFAGGLLANRYGAKWVFGLGNLSQAIFTMLGPLAAKMGVGVFIFTRVMQGVSSTGALLTAMMTIVWFAFWAFFSSSGPEDHRFISEGERAYILQSSLAGAKRFMSLYASKSVLGFQKCSICKN
uniref:Major facilitator superfamily (MFS) profile domain-containing protein n=1 Tax=Romanomermis culicivorax TaxID=13658 RepID=A0A915KFP2_ROMCU